MENKKKTCSALLDRTHISPSKVNLVAELIRNKKALYAQQLLLLCPKKASGLLKKLLDSALANAVKNFGFDPQTLIIERIDVGKSITLKRLMERARGRADRINKKHSHIRIVLGMKTEQKTKNPVKIINTTENKDINTIDYVNINTKPEQVQEKTDHFVEQSQTKTTKTKKTTKIKGEK